MDIEQLKLVLDTARDAGQGAWWIALLWVAKPYFTATLTSLDSRGKGSRQ